MLTVLGRNPVVRSISLPAVPSSRGTNVAATDTLVDIGIPTALSENGSIVGIIDGGVGAILEPWVERKWGLIADADKDSEHGTFIGGLLVGAGAMNPLLLDPSRPACRLIDIDVLPADPGGTGNKFDAYYPGGTPELFDEIEDAVREVRSAHGVRVFNLSLNFDAPGDNQRYGAAAQRLDAIARAYDVIFVISAGNLSTNDRRPEWTEDTTSALTSLARESRSTISEPAESLFNLAVSALNPTVIPNQIPFGLTSYTRRGPGLRGATKPDMAHVGGSGNPTAQHGSGLYSIDESGALVSNSGTSFAAPLVARELADLDASIAGSAPRETLIALLIHEATMPAPLQRGELRGVATDLAGFGVPRETHKTLERPDSEIVMVVSNTILPGEEHSLKFAWPESLTDEGKCRGYARLTLVARPILAYEHGDERIRVNIDAKLMSCPWFDGDSDRPERMRSMPALRKYPAELRERAVRLVFEARDADGGRRGVCTRIGRQLGVPSDTLRGWVQRAEVDGGLRSGTSTDTAVRLVEVEREVRELRRANAILRSASAFFAAELDRPHSR
ncbi:hypothetical protein ABMA10_21835 [Plantibacter sp. RU18]